VGRYDEAVAEARHAQELDPLSPIISGSLGGAYLYSRRLDEAIEQYKKTIQMDPNISMVRSDLAHAYALKKMYPEALAEWQTVITLAGAPAVASAVGEVYRVSGFQAFLQSLLDHLPKDKLTGEHAYDAARLYALLGRKDEALRFLQKTLAARGGQSVDLNCDPVLDSLRSDPGFQALVKKMNFPK
jgi:adenylate cyclase